MASKSSQTDRSPRGGQPVDDTLRWNGQIRGETLLSDLKQLVRRPANALALALGRTGLTPNALTWIGFLLILGVAAVLATGQLLIGGILVLVVSALDMLDGALARSTGQVTAFGGFLDSTLDRLSEAALFFGLLVHFIPRGALIESLLIFGVFTASVTISYIKARAEGLGWRCDVGLMARPERIIVLAVSLIGGALFGNWIIQLGLGALLVLATFTVIQRMTHVWRQSLRQ